MRRTDLPSTAIPASSLKTLETEMQKHGWLRPPRTNDYTPIWFLVETERNIFLWRNGRSVIEQDEYEFWIDIEALVLKRIRQLETSDLNNPFTNPFWSEMDPSSPNNEDIQDLAQKASSLEAQYLMSFLESLKKLIPHVSAFCQAIFLANDNELSDKEIVLLPCRAPASKPLA